MSESATMPVLPSGAPPVEDVSTRPSAGPSEDAPLVRRAARGDVGAARRLYERHFDALVRDVALMTGSALDAEELVQEAFATAFAKLDRYDGRASFGAWTRGIANNLVRKHWRKKARRDRAHQRLRGIVASVWTRSPRSPEELHDRSSRGRALESALGTLAPNLREAFVLIDVQGLSTREAAARAGTSESNIRVRATRARARIRRELELEGWDV